MQADVEAAPQAQAAPGRRLAPIASLYERNYVLLLTGNGLSHAGDMMEHVARGWLVLEMTDSPLALGVVSFATSLPRLFLAVLAGALADRLDRRGLLFLCNAINLAISLVFASLVYFGVVQFWHVLALTLINASFSTLNLVTRQALVPDLVSKEYLTNAIALHSTVRGTTQIVAQSLAGVLIALIGVAGVLYVNAASFVAILLALVLMRLPLGDARKERGGLGQEMREGFSYVWRRQDLLALIALALLPIMLVMPYRALLPVFARDVLNAGASGYGMLMAAPGLGALIASAGAAAFTPRRKGLAMLISLLLASGALVAFTLSPSLTAALLALVIVGAAFNVYRIMNNTILQLLTPREMMGRVMGVYHMDRGMLPVGSLLLGWLASVANAPLAVVVAAIACGLLTGVVIVARPALRRL